MQLMDALNRLERAAQEDSKQSAKLKLAAAMVAKEILTRIVDSCVELPDTIGTPFCFGIDADRAEWCFGLLSSDTDQTFYLAREKSDIESASIPLDVARSFAEFVRKGGIDAMAKAMEDRASNMKDESAVIEAGAEGQ